MKKYLLLFFALFLSLGLLTGCSNSNTESTPTGNGGETMNGVSTYVVNTMKDLELFKGAADGDQIILKGYYQTGDTGAGQFIYYSQYEKESDGGTIIDASDGGKFVRVCSPTERHVDWFGAKSGDQGDDLKAIKSAIDSLENGGTVNFAGGKYVIGDTLVIDSKANNVKLVGKGGFYSTTISASKEMDTLFYAKGAIDGLTIDGITFNGELKAKDTVVLESITNSVIKNSRVFQFTRYGFKLIASEAGKTSNNTFDQLNAITTYADDPIYCLYIGGDYESGNPVENCTFSTCRFDHHQTADSVSVTIAYAQKLSFYRTHFAGYRDDVSDSLHLNAKENNGYPKQINFYDCSINKTIVNEDENGKIGNIMFFGHGTYDNEMVPNHSNIRVITDDGAIAGYTIGDGTDSLPKKTANFDTNTNGEFVHKNLKTTTNSLAVRFNNGGTFTGGTVRVATYGGSTGVSITISVYKWDTDYETTIKGEELQRCVMKDFADNVMEDFTLDSPLGEGEYLVVFHEGKSDGFGVAIWTKSAGQGITTFENGKVADLGIVGTFYIQ